MTIFTRAANFTTDNIGIGIGTQIGRRNCLLHGLGALFIRARNDRGSLFLGDFAREVRTRESTA